VLFILAFGSKQRETVAEDGTACEKFKDINAEKQIIVKIAEDEFVKGNKKGSSKYIGVSYRKRDAKWRAYRHNKNENNKIILNGSYDTEEAAAHASDTLARKLMENGEQSHKLNFPDDDTEVYKKRCSSEYIGVSYRKRDAKWEAQRHSKNKKKSCYNGFYDTEEAAAHASDDLARKLMENGNQILKLNFPDDEAEVYKKRVTSEYIGVSYNKRAKKWKAQRRKNENKTCYNGCYDTEEAAAHASDALARKLMENGNQLLKLNFPGDETEVYKKTDSSKYIGMYYYKRDAKWKTQRLRKSENKQCYNGCYDTEEVAAHTSDTLAKKLMKNGEQGHKLNFPDDDTEHKKKTLKRFGKYSKQLAFYQIKSKPL